MGKRTDRSDKELLTRQLLQSPAPAMVLLNAFSSNISFFLAYAITSLSPVSRIRENE
jgi:hypothetical protein